MRRDWTTIVAVCLCLAACKKKPPPAPLPPEPGRAAVDRALDRLYPGVLDHRMGLEPAAGEKEPPLAEVVAYHLSKPAPQWLYVTYGLSSFGIELTLRLADDSEKPPVWPIHYLRWLAKLVWEDRNPYGLWHSLPHPEGLLDRVSPHSEGTLFIVDPALGTVQTANGSVAFLQALPVRMDEYQLIGRWDAGKLVGELRRQDPDLLWRSGRESVLAGPRRAEILQQAEKDGSSQPMDYTRELRWDEHGVALDEVNRYVMMRILRWRVPYGRAGELRAEGKVLRVEPGPFELELDAKSASLHVPPERARAFADSLEKAGAGATVSFDKKAVFVVGR